MDAGRQVKKMCNSKLCIVEFVILIFIKSRMNGASPNILLYLGKHEIVGVVTKVGTKVDKFKIGDKIGVGYLVGSCNKCENCTNDLENYCPGQVLTANAPLLCAGVTTYSPLRYYGLDKPGMHIGVVGLGGLGHMAVKFAKAFGTKVTVISTSLSKKDEAIERLGEDSFLVSRDPEQMQVRSINQLSFNHKFTMIFM
ncbi:hypothetical protein MTR67_046578 [Solanum verrucosum]|uniref:Alcohol dehydrogenase-like N-terminal domain-containing protein n=1 Tax=Solanum verrucosum TaxID=315347 RepID=A0AAF0ZXC7_SOLVR|nr:hypothetical protein MTR67_046578 [Solanum verrucosum]